MPIPDDAFFEAWEADLPEEERARFQRDGVADGERWRAARLRVLFVCPEANIESGTKASRVAAALGDLRTQTRDGAVGGSFGRPLARWTAMLADGLTGDGAAALPPAAVRRQRLKSAYINLKKTGGGAAARTRRVCDWSARHRDRLLEQIRAVGPDVLILCGGHVHAAWPGVTGDGRVAAGDAGSWAGRPLFAAMHPSNPGVPTAVKDAPIAGFAASPEIAALRRA